MQLKGQAAEKSSKKGCNNKEEFVLSSRTRWSCQNIIVCTPFWTRCLSSPGHWSHMRELPSSHAAASTFKVWARKRSLLKLHITCLDILRWIYRGKVVGKCSLLETGMANQGWWVAGLLLCMSMLGSTKSAPLQTPLILCFKSAANSTRKSTPSLNSSYIWLTPTQSLRHLAFKQSSRHLIEASQ